MEIFLKVTFKFFVNNSLKNRVQSLAKEKLSEIIVFLIYKSQQQLFLANS